MFKFSLALASLLTLAGAEYVWTGTEWKWNEPSLGSDLGTSQNKEVKIDSDTIDGSGDDYDDNYDEEDYDEDYDEEDYGDDYVGKYNKNTQIGFNNPVIESSDDEDFVEGSGDIDPVIDHSDSGFPAIKEEQVPELTDYKEEDIYVENNNDHGIVDDYHEETDDHSDISFYGDNTEDDRVPFVEVTSQPKVPIPTTTTSTTTQKPVWDGGHNESPEVHRKGPTSNRPASFFAQPGILAAVIGGAVVGLLCAILLVMFIVYRMRKKDEGSYALDEPKRSHNVNSYSKPPSREFYA